MSVTILRHTFSDPSLEKIVKEFNKYIFIGFPGYICVLNIASKSLRATKSKETVNHY